MSSKKISELSEATGVVANTLMPIVDTTGPTTKRITVQNFVNSIPSNSTFQMTLTVNGNVTLNATTFSANMTSSGNNYFSVNNITIAKTTTPANTTDVAVAAGGVGQMWSDGSYIYLRSNTTNIKRVAIATW